MAVMIENDYRVQKQTAARPENNYKGRRNKTRELRESSGVVPVFVVVITSEARESDLASQYKSLHNGRLFPLPPRTDPSAEAAS